MTRCDVFGVAVAWAALGAGIVFIAMALCVYFSDRRDREDRP
jgi:hypothetical protein